jgi:capsid assembly protease
MYPHILSSFYGSYWCILPDRLMELEAYLQSRHFRDAPAMPQAAMDRPAYSRAGEIAVIPVHGTIYPRGGMNPVSGGTTAERIAMAFDQAANDKTIAAIVADFDTPGGAVSGTPEAAAAIRRATQRKPVHGVANHMMASAGMWLGSQCTTLSCTPSGSVGSIGVLRRHVDESAAIEKEGLKVTQLTTAKYKAEGSPLAPLSDETTAYYMGEMQKIHANFVQAVATGRHTTVANVEANYGQGRMIMAEEAKMRGMVDRIATLDEVVAGVMDAMKTKDRVRARLVNGGI